MIFNQISIFFLIRNIEVRVFLHGNISSLGALDLVPGSPGTVVVVVVVNVVVDDATGPGSRIRFGSIFKESDPFSYNRIQIGSDCLKSDPFH